MDPDQAAPLGAVRSGHIVFAFMRKAVSSAFRYMIIYAAGVKADNILG